jgi:hypothetical protein
LILLNGVQLYAGGDFPVIGSRQAGMGRSSVALTDFWNLQNNQAGVALIDQFSVAIYYESQFSLNQLSMKSAGFLAPTKFGTLGLTFNYFGYSLYNDMKIGLVYARSFGQYLRIGLQLDYVQTTLGDDYGSKSNVTFEFGLQSVITENITLGAWVYNPMQVKLADYDDEKIPAIFRFGIAWEITAGFIATVEAEKNTYIQPIIIRGGLEYGINEKFFFRGGFSTQKEILSMGFGFNLKPVKFDVSAVMHESLGFSPQATLIFQF